MFKADDQSPLASLWDAVNLKWLEAMTMLNKLP